MSLTQRTEASSSATGAISTIRDYAVVGDCHGAALVSRDASVDWCCLGRFDADPVFCRLLDRDRGGYWTICPSEPYQTKRAYVPNTNILRTTFSTASGKAAVIDFMPVGRKPGASVHDYIGLSAPLALARIVEAVEGEVELALDYRPSVAFARRAAKLRRSEGAILVENGPSLYTDVPLEIESDRARAAVHLRAGERRHLLLAARSGPHFPVDERVGQYLSVTQAFWEEWSRYCRYQGKYADEVLRSALTLKLLTYAPSGAIAAAATTSLPEELGGQRNWDYRFCWLRDATFSLYALAMLGYSGEAGRFGDYFHRVGRASHPRVQIMYGIDGERELTEQTLEHLAGYRDSRPVHVGNGAYQQTQLDVYGETLDWSLLHHTIVGKADEDTRRLIAALADFVAEHWNDPGQGIWEMRGPPRHHVFGKIMSWVAIDRAIRILGEDPRRMAVRDDILRSIEQHGVEPTKGYLRQAYGDTRTDASLLLSAVVGVPLRREVLVATIDEIRRTLGRGDYLRRYDADDGLPGQEGAFLPCSFWLVDALLMTGQAEEARELFERLLPAANDVGLFSEEIDPDSGELLGNFPQALTHLAVIQNAAHFGLYESGGLEALAGTHADRASRTVESSMGVRGLWASIKKAGLTGRIISSKKSVLDL
ncbi:MAG TPA: glycoside hydrolase family 15 protein [Pirellulales bacterium]|nr:glycoside hydrolase family 15 protein [Pirellulales bacterium]